jgi:hypothetical protein
MSLSRRAVLVGAAGVLATNGDSERRMTHIALLGGSVIDNKAYVGIVRTWPRNYECSRPRSGS